ncbi:hypothetical protein SAMN04488023_1722 [Pedobacter rhizosphaerae]|uniref:Uncharacterized protein n=2 Tax=Pedobacter rhizosphaerae TaxID=390241 RepID=A0A1H9WCG9_9SPHI|nr:hypothetical protein SAMN04488023_1722 [Pedobacter rhizosphaerae]
MIQEIKNGLNQALIIMIKNTSKIIKITILAIVIAFVGYIGYMFLTFDLFEVSNDKLKVINVEGKPYKIILYRINGNATVQSGIQVRKLDNGQELTLKQYDRYDSLMSFSVKKDSLKLVLKNTNFMKQKPDTLYLKIP